MSTIVEKIRSWARKQRDLEYIAKQGGFFAGDTGVSVDDARRMVTGRSDTRERMLDMAGRFGVTAQQIDADCGMASEISLACAECGSERTCRRVLSGNASAEPHDFCPNAARYEEIAAGSR
ncbi:MAG: DUF6455 family protein [Nitratireductor sp.]